MNSINDYSKENMIVKEEILEDLHKGVCKVTFTKKDGTERVMKCTLVEDYLPKIEQRKSKRIRHRTNAMMKSVQYGM